MKLYSHKDYIDQCGLYYIYIHVYENKIVYIGKGSKSRARDFANRSNIYKQYIESIGKKKYKSIYSRRKL